MLFGVFFAWLVVGFFCLVYILEDRNRKELEDKSSTIDLFLTHGQDEKPHLGAGEHSRVIYFPYRQESQSRKVRLSLF